LVFADISNFIDFKTLLLEPKLKKNYYPSNVVMQWEAYYCDFGNYFVSLQRLQGLIRCLNTEDLLQVNFNSKN